MTARTRSPHARPEQRRRASAQAAQADRLGWVDNPIRLRAALGLSLLGAVLVVLGAARGVVLDLPARGYASLPLLILVAALPPLLAGLMVVRGRPVVAAAVLGGAALVTVGRAVIDLQLVIDPLLAARPELLVPTSLAPLSPALGLWLLIAGDLVTILAGLLAAGRAGAVPGSPYAEEFDDPAGTSSLRLRRRLIAVAFGCGTVAAAGLVTSPFHSDNAFLLPGDVIASPTPAGVGALLAAFGTFLGCLVAASSVRPPVTRGLALGVLAGVSAVALPAVVAGLAVPRLNPALGPYLALVATAVLVAAVFLLPDPAAHAGLDADAHRPDAHRPDADRPDADRAETVGLHADRSDPDRLDADRYGTDRYGTESADLRLEPGRLRRVAGVLGVLTGLAAAGGAFGDLLVVEAGLEQPSSFANRPLLPVGLLVAALGAALLVNRWAAAARPTFAVVLASVPLVGAAVLDTALTGSAISPAVHVGAAVWLTGIAVLLAVAAAGAAVVAGGVEREDVDLTERPASLPLIGLLTVAVLLCVGAFGLPVMRAPDFVGPGIWSQFRLASWGLLVAMAVVAAAAAVSVRARPVRAAALLLGAAAVVGVRLLELPLTADRAEHATAGPGLWLSLATVVTLVVAAVVALAPAAREG